MLLFIECISAYILFTIIILSTLFKNPLNHIMSYPSEIRKRVESLPQYSNIIKQKEKRHLHLKIMSPFIIAIILAFIAYLSGAKDFHSAFIHVFVLFMAVNIYDLFILDIGLFCHMKRFRIPGTEDMTAEYKNPTHHIRGATIGTLIGFIVSLISATMVHLFNLIY